MVLLHLLPIRLGAFSNPYFSHCLDQHFLGDCRNTEFSSQLHFKIIFCNQSLALPECAWNYLSQQSKRYKPETKGKYCELSQGRCETLRCRTGNCLFKMTVGGCWPALILGKYDPVSRDGVLYFCREGEKVTYRGTYRLNCFIAALFLCSIRLFPERITPCSLSTHQVHHYLMKTSTAPSAMAFRQAQSLKKYKLVLVLTIEMSGTVPHQINLFTLRFAGLTYQAQWRI